MSFQSFDGHGNKVTCCFSLIIIRYHCKDGYSLNAFHGQEIYRCLANGEWSPRVPPVCISLETGLAGHDDPLEQVSEAM